MRSLSKSLSAIVILALASLSSSAAEPPTAAALLERSIGYHDPEGTWGLTPLTLAFDQSRPDGSTRQTEVTIDIHNELFSWRSRRDGHELAGRLEGDHCVVTLDGSAEISAEDVETYRLTCETLIRRRNYYTYLWGLPMKLRDPGTRIDESVTLAEFRGRDLLALRVTYADPVGSDTWYFYFDPVTAALSGYRFFHDESKNDGEYITLDGEVVVEGLRLPQTRAWYYNKDDGYLGTDTLVGPSPPPSR